jgi:hypothetical protein
MILNIKSMFENLLAARSIEPCQSFTDVINNISEIGLTSNTDGMYWINRLLFNNKLILAKKLYQHSLYEKMGGELIQTYANKLAEDKLKDDMLAQARDEFKHGKMLKSLIRYTGYKPDEFKGMYLVPEDEKLPDFKDDIQVFICFIHAAEIRTLIMLHQYLNIIENADDSMIKNMRPMLVHIKMDEEQHAAYTANYINHWLLDKDSLKETLINCFIYTNKESWQELANMTNNFANEQVSLI